MAILAQTAASAAEQSSVSLPPAGITNCAACHGNAGQGDPAHGYPRLAGQPREYLLRQLAAFAEGRRKNAIMEPVARALKPDQLEDALRFAATPPSKPPGPAAKRDPTAERLATVGDDKRRIQACNNCHGPDGVGEGATPYLAGQISQYLASALASWKIGARNTDPSGQMPAIAKALSDADIQALARYYAALPAPGTAVGNVKPAPVPKGNAPAPGNSARPSAAPKKPVGVEQGQPTEGSGVNSQGGQARRP